MKRFFAKYGALITLIVLLLSGCSDPNAVIDKSTVITDHNWAYDNKITYAVKIDNTAIAYNLYLNLRVTSDYKYANLFVLIRRTDPGKQTAMVRYEFPLAGKDGEWYGKGSGNLYSYQMPFIANYKFPVKGTYLFTIEQNMRDNPLHEVSDVGLRVEKAAP